MKQLALDTQSFETGVSRFSGLSIFSARNNPQDITLQQVWECNYSSSSLRNGAASCRNTLYRVRKVAASCRKALYRVRKVAAICF
jgi:hypothetical protein